MCCGVGGVCCAGEGYGGIAGGVSQGTEVGSIKIGPDLKARTALHDHCDSAFYDGSSAQDCVVEEEGQGAGASAGKAPPRTRDTHQSTKAMDIDSGTKVGEEKGIKSVEGKPEESKQQAKKVGVTFAKLAAAKKFIRSHFESHTHAEQVEYAMILGMYNPQGSPQEDVTERLFHFLCKGIR